MVKIILFLILSSFSFGSLQYLEKSTVNETAFETVSSSWLASDDATLEVDIGFTFPFNGSGYNQVWLNSNGMLSFSSSNNVYVNNTLPYSSEPQSIYPYWDDMNRARGGSITYGLLGSGDNEHFIVYWNNTPRYADDSKKYTFQVVLYKNGDIRFRYESASFTNGDSATVGVQENTSNYDEHSYNSTAIFNATKDILYTNKVARLSITKDSCVIEDPINGTTFPKRIVGAKIRYVIEVSNSGGLEATDVLVDDTLSSDFDYATIQNIQVQNGVCDCLGISSAINNGSNGTGEGEHPIKIDFGVLLGGTVSSPEKECGYFEVTLK